LRSDARILAGVLAVALGASRGAQAEALLSFAPAAAGTGFEESFDRALENDRTPVIRIDAASLLQAEGGTAEKPPEVKRPHTFWIGVVSFLTLAGSARNSFGDGPNQKFHFTNEGWFGQNTYAGGGDKASHFVSYYIVARLLTGVNVELGMRPDNAALLGSGVSALAGLVTELGDGRGRYGFSWEDFAMDTLGAVSWLGIAHFGLNDLISFQAGLVPHPQVVCCPYGGFGKDYTEEIYAGSLKIAGLGQRAHFDPGPGRYLLFSITYGSKGYPYSAPVVRERQIGFEFGINFGQIMRELGVPEQKLWGKVLYFLFDVVRIPYTQIGFQYDLNSHKWRGPGIGDSFPGGGR